MIPKNRIKLLNWLDKVTPNQLKEFDRKLVEVQQSGDKQHDTTENK